MRTDVNCICMYTPSADGGHARYTWELMTQLCRHSRGFRYELVTSEDFDPQFRSDLYSAHTILPVLRHKNSYRSKFGWVASRITHYARRELRFLNWLGNRPDVAAVHFQEWTPWLAAPLFRRIRRMGKKVFYTVHNIVPHKYPRYLPRSVMDFWVRRGCRACDGLFVHTDLLAEELSEFLEHEHPPIHVVPHGVWTLEGVEEPPPLSERMDRRRLLFFGEMRRNKGLHLLLQAAELLPEYSVTVAGEACDGDYFKHEILPQIQKLRELRRDVNLINQFVPESQVPELMRAHSAIVLPYTGQFRAQSGVVFLALAHELPVVASEVGGLRDLLSEFRVGVTFSESSPEALASAIHKLFDKADRGELRNQILAAQDRFSWREAANRTMNGYLNSSEAAVEEDECAVQTTAAH